MTILEQLKVDALYHFSTDNSSLEKLVIYDICESIKEVRSRVDKDKFFDLLMESKAAMQNVKSQELAERLLDTKKIMDASYIKVDDNVLIAIIYEKIMKREKNIVYLQKLIDLDFILTIKFSYPNVIIESTKDIVPIIDNINKELNILKRYIPKNLTNEEKIKMVRRVYGDNYKPRSVLTKVPDIDSDDLNYLNCRLLEQYIYWDYSVERFEKKIEDSVYLDFSEFDESFFSDSKNKEKIKVLF